MTVLGWELRKFRRILLKGKPAFRILQALQKAQDKVES